MKQQKLLQWILYIGLGVILFILPFPRGLFFEKEIVPIQILIFALLMIWSYTKIVKKEKLQIDSFMIISVILLPIAYIFPLLLGRAASHYGALTYIFRYLSYTAIFMMLSDMIKTKKHLFIGLNILAGSGVIAAILGIDAGLGKTINNLLGFIGGIDEYGRISGVLQYPNSFAAYMATIFFLFIGLAILSKERYQKAIYAALEILPLTVLFMTVSRGAIVFVPIIFILLIIIIPTKEKRLEVILSTLPAIGISLYSGRTLTGMIPLISASEGQDLVLRGWMIALVSFVVSFLLSFALLYIHIFLSKISTKIYQVSIGVLMILGVFGGVGLFKTGLYAKVLPQFLVNRFTQINSITDITSGRNNFYRDGIKMLKDHWVLGAGGNAWSAMYKQYQSYFYGSSEAHSLPLQMWIETGLFGILTLVFLIIALIFLYLKNRKSESGCEISLLLIPILMIFAHSSIDFNFSYFSIPLITFALMGCINGLKVKKDINLSFSPWIVFLLSGIIILFPISWQIGRHYAVKATTAINQENLKVQDIKDSIDYMEKAIDFNGWNHNYMISEYKSSDKDISYDLRILYKNFYEILKENDPEALPTLISKQIELYQKAYRLEPNNHYIAMHWAQILIENGETEQGLEAVEKSVKLNPMYPVKYQELALAYFSIGQYYVNQGNDEIAQPYLERIIKIEQDIEEVNQRAIEKVVMTETTKEYIEQAKQLLNK